MRVLSAHVIGSNDYLENIRVYRIAETERLEQK